MNTHIGVQGHFTKRQGTMKKFIKNNEMFMCEYCGKLVPEHPSSSRDHCIHCLYGLHVDINPGDRLNDCKGLLIPIGLKIANAKTQIVYSCNKCGKKVFCVAAEDDNKDKVVELSKKTWS